MEEAQKLEQCIEEACKAALEKARLRYSQGHRGWNDNSDIDFLYDRLDEELTELNVSLVEYDTHLKKDSLVNAADECLDIINFACFIRHCLLKTLKQKQSRQASEAHLHGGTVGL
jgi:hypothetical protein